METKTPINPNQMIQGYIFLNLCLYFQGKNDFIQIRFSACTDCHLQFQISSSCNFDPKFFGLCPFPHPLGLVLGLTTGRCMQPVSGWGMMKLNCTEDKELRIQWMGGIWVTWLLVNQGVCGIRIIFPLWQERRWSSG